MPDSSGKTDLQVADARLLKGPHKCQILVAERISKWAETRLLKGSYFQPSVESAWSVDKKKGVLTAEPSYKR